MEIYLKRPRKLHPSYCIGWRWIGYFKFS